MSARSTQRHWPYGHELSASIRAIMRARTAPAEQVSLIHQRGCAPNQSSTSQGVAGRCTCRRVRARRLSVSEAAGGWGSSSVSEVAWSLKGMPTTSFAPSFLYVNSGFSRSCARPQHAKRSCQQLVWLIRESCNTLLQDVLLCVVQYLPCVARHRQSETDSV